MDYRVVSFLLVLSFVHVNFARNIMMDEVLSENAIDESHIDSDDQIIDLSHFGSALFGQPDEAVGEKLASLNGSTEVNPEELGSYVEGDILIPKSSMKGRSGIPDSAARWPGGIIPYRIDPGFGSRELGIIQDCISDYHKYTCVKFVPRTSEPDYLVIKGDNSGCWSSVGKVGGPQTINLQRNGCFSQKGTTCHEIMHALGFYHEQNRYERDSYIVVNYQNIQSGTEPNFDKLRPSEQIAFGVPYDCGSVMHYSGTAFSKNGQPTIVPKIPLPPGVKLGQRDGFSETDIARINRMYECDSIPLPPAGGPSSGPIAGPPQQQYGPGSFGLLTPQQGAGVGGYPLIGSQYPPQGGQYPYNPYPNRPSPIAGPIPYNPGPNAGPVPPYPPPPYGVGQGLNGGLPFGPTTPRPGGGLLGLFRPGGFLNNLGSAVAGFFSGFTSDEQKDGKNMTDIVENSTKIDEK